MERKQVLPISHAKIIDGFAELRNHKNYLPFSSFCGICDAKINVTPADQKYILEEKGIPVKMMKRGALLCESCSKRRGRMTLLRKGNKFLEEENGRADLKHLENEEKELQQKSKGLFNSIDWPY